MYTASTALLEALHEANLAFLFANLDSDHPGIIEAWAEALQVVRQERRCAVLDVWLANS